MMVGGDLSHVACRFVNRASVLSDTSQEMGDTQINRDIGAVTSHALTAKDGMPLRADFYVPAAADATAERGLLVLIHGYCEHRGRYGHVAEHLLKQGYTVLAGDLRGHGESGGERGFVQRFADYVDDIDALRALGLTLDAAFRKTRPPREGTAPPSLPVLVAHSMGGLVCRAYLRRFGGDRVEALVTMGSPHHGTFHAYMANGENGQQMRPGNRWLRELNDAVVPVPFTSIYSVHDTVISPQDSSVMPGADNVCLSAIGHVSMPGGAQARAQLVQALTRLHAGVAAS